MHTVTLTLLDKCILYVCAGNKGDKEIVDHMVCLEKMVPLDPQEHLDVKEFQG